MVAKYTAQPNAPIQMQNFGHRNKLNTQLQYDILLRATSMWITMNVQLMQGINQKCGEGRRAGRHSV